jgi:hypothetical protein
MSFLAVNGVDARVAKAVEAGGAGGGLDYARRRWRCENVADIRKEDSR